MPPGYRLSPPHELLASQVAVGSSTSRRARRRERTTNRQSARAPSLALSLITYTPLGSALGIANDSVACQRHSVRPVSELCAQGGWRAARSSSLCRTSRPPAP